MAQKLSPQASGHIGRRVLFTLKNPPPPNRLVSTREGDIERGKESKNVKENRRMRNYKIKTESKECQKV
jgi:hypothetical protein